MSPEFREEILRQLRKPGPRADLLIERYLGRPTGPGGCKPYTREVEEAVALMPKNVHFVCGRFEEGNLFWCDVGTCPQVQAWGETMACAIAGAVFAYLTHPDSPVSKRSGVARQAG